MDYAFVFVLILILWFAAKCTRRLLKRLEPPEHLAVREMIIVKKSMNGVGTSHLVDPDDPAAGERTRPADESIAAAELSPPAPEPAPVAGEAWNPLVWEPSPNVGMTSR